MIKCGIDIYFVVIINTAYEYIINRTADNKQKARLSQNNHAPIKEGITISIRNHEYMFNVGISPRKQAVGHINSP